MSDLSKKTVKELREIAKDLNITGRWDMTKAQLIDSINACSFSDSDISFETDCVVDESIQKNKKSTIDFLSNSEVGTLVAFKKPNSEIAFSGKLVLVEIEKENVIVETKMGTKYTLKPDDILWVKTGKRWPKWVFEMFNNKKEGDIDNAISKVGE